MRTVVIYLAMCLLGCGKAVACEGKTLIFEDSFLDESGGWEIGDLYSIANGAMNLKLAADSGGVGARNGTFLVKDADICVDFEFPQGGREFVPGLGITFWDQGIEKGWYTVILFSDGTLQVARLFNKQWNMIVSQALPGANINLSGKNTLRVTLKSERVTIFVNNVKAKEIRAQAPAQEAKFGVMASRKKKGVEQRLSVLHYKVTTVD